MEEIIKNLQNYKKNTLHQKKISKKIEEMIKGMEKLTKQENEIMKQNLIYISFLKEQLKDAVAFEIDGITYCGMRVNGKVVVKELKNILENNNG